MLEYFGPVDRPVLPPKHLGSVQVAERQLQEYKGLRSMKPEHSMQQAVCDRCLQPIDDGMFHTNVSRLGAEVASAAAERNAVVQANSATQVHNCCPACVHQRGLLSPKVTSMQLHQGKCTTRSAAGGAAGMVRG